MLLNAYSTLFRNNRSSQSPTESAGRQRQVSAFPLSRFPLCPLSGLFHLIPLCAFTASLRIPTGFRPKAHGLRRRSYPGSASLQTFPTATRLRRSVCSSWTISGRNAVGIVFVFNRLPKLGAGAPTLGFKAQSGWDCFFPAFPFQVFRRFLAYSSCFAVIDPALTLICVF